MWDLEAGTCQHCGQDIEKCSEPGRTWYPQRHVDYAAMELAGAQALYARQHEERPYHDGTFRSWSKERDAAHPFHYDDGVTIYVAETDLNPDDAFLSEESASPLPPDSDVHDDHQ